MDEDREEKAKYDDGKPWGFIDEAGQWIEIPKGPLIRSHLGPPPFDVILPNRAVRRIVHRPEA